MTHLTGDDCCKLSCDVGRRVGGQHRPILGDHGSHTLHLSGSEPAHACIIRVVHVLCVCSTEPSPRLAEHTHTRTHAHSHTHTRAHTRAHTRTHTLTHTHIDRPTNTSTRAENIHVHISTTKDTHTHTHMIIHAPTHTYTHIHTHTRIYPRAQVHN